MIKEITRREFIATAALTTGFALAVQPVFAKVITTDTTHLPHPKLSHNEKWSFGDLRLAIAT